MNRKITTLLFILCLTSMISGNLFAEEDITWVAKSDMFTARAHIGCGVIGDKIYVIGGYDGFSSLSTVEEYDPILNNWTVKASLGIARFGVAVGVVDNRIYAIGGRRSMGGGSLTLVEEYDPVMNQWIVKSSMPTARSMAITAVVNGKIYVLGGEPSYGSISNAVEVYDPLEDEWTTLSSMLEPRYAFAVGVVNDRIYAIGGYYFTGNLRKVEEFDPVTNSWSIKPDMQEERSWHNAVSINNKIYVIGGADSTGLLNKVEEYDPSNDVWVQKENSLIPRMSFGAGVVDNRIYVMGGYTTNNPAITPTVEEGTVNFLVINQPPVAVCQNITIPVDENCEAFITPEDVDGGSYDPDEGATITLSVDNLGPFTIGEHCVNLTVTDEHGEFDTCQAKVSVIAETPPPVTIVELTNYVINLVIQGNLDNGAGNSLMVKLDAAIKAIDKGKVKTAINQLNAFKNSVKALEKSKRLSSFEAQLLIDAADLIIGSL